MMDEAREREAHHEWWMKVLPDDCDPSVERQSRDYGVSAAGWMGRAMQEPEWREQPDEPGRVQKLERALRALWDAAGPAHLSIYHPHLSELVRDALKLPPPPEDA